MIDASACWHLLPEMDEAASPADRLAEIVACCRKRVARAEEKLAIATTEREAAIHALGGAERRLARWHEQNPDPQGSIFEGLTDV